MVFLIKVLEYNIFKIVLIIEKLISKYLGIFL